MALSLRVIPGYQFGETERIDQVKLNQLGRPTIELQGSIASSAIPPGSITADKLDPNLIAHLPGPTNAERKDLIMFQDATDGLLHNTTVGQIVDLGISTLTPIAAVDLLADHAWIIQKGVNCSAAVVDVLRQAINQQTALSNPTDIDPLADSLLIYDASAPVGANQNRKASVNTAVWSVTNKLIADSALFSGTLDPANDELLLRDFNATAGAQQFRIKLKDVIAQVGGIKAWANFDGTVQLDVIRNTFNAANSTIITLEFDAPNGRKATGLKPGDWIWFHQGNAGAGVVADTPYYIYPADATTIELYRTQAGALARTQADRVTLTQNAENFLFYMWRKSGGAPLVRGSANIASVIRTPNSQGEDDGRYRLFFTNQPLNANYAIFVTASSDHEGGGSEGGVIGIVDFQYAVPSTASFDVQTKNRDGSATDSKYVNVLVIG